MKKQIKKAEITMTTIVSIIIVLFTLGVLLLIFSQISWKGDVNREVCHQSVVLRGSLPDSAILSLVAEDGSKGLVNLKCKTKRICVTGKTFFQGEGECAEILGDDFITYRIDLSNQEKAEEQIKQLMGREMAECWEMMGRGNLQIFMRPNQDFKPKITGVVCSRISFDESVTSNVQEVTGLEYYLLTHKVPNNEISYWDYFRNALDGNTIALLAGGRLEQLQKGKLNLKETKAIVYAEAGKSNLGELIGGAVGVVVPMAVGGQAGVAFSPSFGYLGLKAGGWVSKKISNLQGLFVDGNQEFSSGIYLVDYNKESFDNMGITSFENTA